MSFNVCKTELIQWVDDKIDDLSDWHQVIFDHGETTWREYQSSAWYVERLRAEGFSVEQGSGGMPTALCAEGSNGEGPTIAVTQSMTRYPAIARRPIPYSVHVTG